MRLKWLLIIPLAFLIVVIVAVYVILSSYDFNKLKPRIEQAAYVATGRELKLVGDIELEIGLTPSLVVEDVSFQNAEWGSSPTAVSVKRFEVEVALLPLLGGNINVKRLVLIEPVVLIETDSRGKSNLEFKPPEKSKAEAKAEKEPTAEGEPKLPDLMVGELLVLDARLTYKDGKSGKTTSVKLDRLSVKGSGMKGTIDFDLDGSVDNRSFGVSGRLDSIAKILDPTRGLVKISPLNIRLGQNKITGTIEADISTKRPRVKADLASDRFDLGEFQEKGGDRDDGQSAKKSVKKKKVFSSEPIPVDTLKGVDIELRLKVKKLILAALVLNDLNIEMTLKNGHLKLAPLTALVGGGALDANIDIRPIGKALALDARVKVTGLDLKKLGAELKVTEVLNGTIDANVNIKGRGASVAALMSTLNGEKKVVMGRGRIDNKYLKFLGGDLGSNVIRLLNPLAEKEDFTVVNCMVVDFNITDGLAKSRALVFDTSYMSVVGKGKINLKTEKLDISLNPQPKKGLGTGGLGKLTLSLGELARALKLGGTLANPRLAVDKTQTAVTIGKYIGGKAIFGPVGIATALVGTSKDDENPCLTAIEASKKSVEAKPATEKDSAKEPSIPIPAELKEIGEGLKKLFGQ